MILQNTRVNHALDIHSFIDNKRSLINDELIETSTKAKQCLNTFDDIIGFDLQLKNLFTSVVKDEFWTDMHAEYGNISHLFYQD